MTSDQLPAPLVKRSLHNLRLEPPPAHIDYKRRSDAGVFNRQVSQADVLFQIRRVTARSDHAGLSIVDEYRIVVAGDAFIGHFKTDELALQSFFFLSGEAIAPNEIALVQFANPAKVGFEHGRRAVNVVAVERHLGFEPERVARRQAAGQNAA